MLKYISNKRIEKEIHQIVNIKEKRGLVKCNFQFRHQSEDHWLSGLNCLKGNGNWTIGKLCRKCNF